MQQTIKTYRKVTTLVCLAGVLTFAGCSGCNGNNGKTTGSDTAAKKDSVSMSVKKDSDSTAAKKADTTISPSSHMPKEDTSTKQRPLVRKT